MHRRCTVTLLASTLLRLDCAAALLPGTGLALSTAATAPSFTRTSNHHDHQHAPPDPSRRRPGGSRPSSSFFSTPVLTAARARTKAARLPAATVIATTATPSSSTSTSSKRYRQHGQRQQKQQRRYPPPHRTPSSRPFTVDPTWGLRPPSADTVIGERPVTALRMANSAEQDKAVGGSGGGEGDGAALVATPVMKGAWISLAMLLLVYISNQWTRSLVYYVQNFDVATTAENAQEFMNVGLGFDETQYGLLASFSFTLLFSTFSLVAGRAVDVVSRKTATIVSCLVWSAMAAGTAVATGFPAVFILRVLQGSAQAFTVAAGGFQPRLLGYGGSDSTAQLYVATWSTPAAYTLISDLFPPSSRGTANAIYSSGVYLGGALASLSLLLNGAIGWRESHLVVAAVGFAVAFLSFVLLQDPGKGFGGGVGATPAGSHEAEQGEAASLSSGDPAESVAAAVRVMVGEVAVGEVAVGEVAVGEEAAKGAGGVMRGEGVEGAAAEMATILVGGGTAEQGGHDGNGDERESFREALEIVFASDTVKLLFAATAFRFCAGFGIGVWCAPFFRGQFPTFTSQYSVLNAFVVAGGGLLSSFLGGVISDKYSAQEPRARAWVPMVGSLLAVPCWIGVVSGTDFYTSLAFLLAEYIVAECWFGPTVTILQEGLPPSVRGVGQGVFSTLSAFGTLAPPLMGYLMQQGGMQIQDVLMFTVPAFYIASAACFYFVGESLLTDLGKMKQA